MTNVNEVSPPGWGHTKAEKEKTKPNKPKSKIGGTADAMKKAQKRGDIPKNMNIFALMWSMKNKGDKPHYKPGVKDKLKKKYKGPEGQNEEKKVTDQYPPTRLFKNVPNSTVKKANKEGDKAKKEAEKAVLGEPPKSGPSGETMHSKDNVYEDGELVSLVAQAIKSLPEGEWADSKAQEKKDSDRLIAIQNEREKRYQAQQAAKKQAAAKKEETEVEEDVWRKNFKKQAAKRIGDSKRRKQAQQHSPGQRVPPKTKNYGEAYNSILDKQSARILGRPDTPKKQKLSITPAGKKALKKGDQKLSITAKGRAAVKEGAKELEARNAAKADKKQQGGSLRHKVWPASASMKMPKEDMSLAPKGKGRKAAKALYKENEVTHFGDVLRQAIEEAKKVNAIDTINKIVKTKTMGKLHGQKVDLFTASAIQSVYHAINQKNKEKMNSVMSKDVHGLLKMADFSMKQMKR